MGLIAMFTYFAAHEIANAYTDDMDTVALLRYCMQQVSTCLFITGTTLSLQGALKALQQQDIASRVLLTCYYMVSLPMAFAISVLFEVGITGLWKGMSIGQALIPTIYAYIFINIDWMDVFELNRR